jgi:hypothetical protein
VFAWADATAGKQMADTHAGKPGTQLPSVMHRRVHVQEGERYIPHLLHTTARAQE